LKVALFTALREISIHQTPEPTLDRADGAKVRIGRVGVCGSDVHYYVRGRIGDQIVRYPATLGHECAGTVVEVGSEVTRLKPGDRVAIDPAFSCGECDQCRLGRVNTCRNLQFMGCPGEAPGAVAEYRVVPAANCYAIPEGMTLDQAALAEPISIGLQSVRIGSPAAGARIAVLGSGPIGLSVLLCAKAGGPCTVYATDLIDARLEVARRCGADWTGNARTGDVAATIRRLEPRGLDLVFECSGDPDIIDRAQSLLAPGGTLVLVGIPSIPRVSFDSHVMRRQELTFKNVRRQVDCVAPVIELIAAGRLDPSPLLTHRFPLAAIREAFELAAAYRDAVVKAMLELPAA
jgi:L-iditol 2-dehydrogenase